MYARLYRTTCPCRSTQISRRRMPLPRLREMVKVSSTIFLSGMITYITSAGPLQIAMKPPWPLKGAIRSGAGREKMGTRYFHKIRKEKWVTPFPPCMWEHPQGAGRGCNADELATTTHRRLRRDLGGGTITAIGPGAALLQGGRCLRWDFGRGRHHGIGPRAGPPMEASGNLDDRLTIMVVGATPDDERDFGVEGGGKRSQKFLAARSRS